MNSLFINETALHTRLLHPPPLPLLSLLQAGGVAGGRWPTLAASPRRSQVLLRESFALGHFGPS